MASVASDWPNDAWVTETADVIDLGTPFSAVVQLTVNGAPGGDARYHRLYADGRVVGGGPGPVKNPDIALTVPLADATQILQGDLDPSVAFMQGRLKTAGDNGLLLALLAAWSSPSGVSSLSRLSAAAGGA